MQIKIILDMKDLFDPQASLSRIHYKLSSSTTETDGSSSASVMLRFVTTKTKDPVKNLLKYSLKKNPNLVTFTSVQIFSAQFSYFYRYCYFARNHSRKRVKS